MESCSDTQRGVPGLNTSTQIVPGSTDSNHSCTRSLSVCTSRMKWRQPIPTSRVLDSVSTATSANWRSGAAGVFQRLLLGSWSGGGVVVVSLREGECLMLQETLIRVQGRMSGKPRHTQPIVRKENLHCYFNFWSQYLCPAELQEPTERKFVTNFKYLGYFWS